VNTINSINPINSINSSDPKVMAKQIETIFLNEFLKIMMEQTSFNKDKTVSTYMPFITSQIADYLAERGIGAGEFFLRSSEPNTLVQQSGRATEPQSGSFIQPSFNLQSDSSLSLRLPVEGKITSRYGLRHDPIDGRLRHHNGIDIAAPEGTPVLSAATGRVVFSGFSSGYGNCVIVGHDNGFTTLYAHNSVNLVKTGDVVDKNKVIALSGLTGRATGPHLHFEVRKDGMPVDPILMMG
jgi:murein DD-endopeptidase MepM/ murein hydrolase activator NlpD